MELKLEITGATLTPEQRKAIQQKLKEIKTITKNKEIKTESRANRVIEKAFNKLRYHSEKENKQGFRKPFLSRRPLQSQNGTPSEAQVCNNECMHRKETPIEQEHPLRGSFPQIEKKTAKLNDSFHKVQERCSALYSALGQEFCLVVDRSQGSEKILTQVPVEIVEQICDFVRDTEAFLSLYQNTRSITF